MPPPHPRRTAHLLLGRPPVRRRPARAVEAAREHAAYRRAWPSPKVGSRGRSSRSPPAGILVGRNPECSLVLDDDFTSGRHLRLFLREGSWWVEDLGSTNGTFLDAARLTTAQPVGVGSVLRIGRTALELHG
jgi:hypothetical protein